MAETQQNRALLSSRGALIAPETGKYFLTLCIRVQKWSNDLLILIRMKMLTQPAKTGSEHLFVCMTKAKLLQSNQRLDF